MPRHTDDDREPTNRRATNSERTAKQRTMSEVNHTNPMTGETFGDSQVFERGKVVIVDGGEAESRDEDEDGEDEPMGEVDHTPRKGAPDASEVYDRGVERVEEDEDSTEDDTEPDVAADV